MLIVIHNKTVNSKENPFSTENYEITAIYINVHKYRNKIAKNSA